MGDGLTACTERLQFLGDARVSCTPALPFIQCVGTASHASQTSCSSPAGFGQDPVAGSSCFACCRFESQEFLVRSPGLGLLGKLGQVMPWCFLPCWGRCLPGGESCRVCSGDEGTWSLDTESRCPRSSPMPQSPRESS